MQSTHSSWRTLVIRRAMVPETFIICFPFHFVLLGLFLGICSNDVRFPGYMIVRAIAIILATVPISICMIKVARYCADVYTRNLRWICFVQPSLLSGFLFLYIHDLFAFYVVMVAGYFPVFVAFHLRKV